MLRRAGISAGLVAMAFVVGGPTGASAATFFVDGSGSANPCTNPPPAPGCATIMEAVNQARAVGFPGGDTIRVKAGTYPESTTFGVYLNDTADTGDVIVGAGSGTGGTVLKPDSNGSGPALGTGVAGPTDLTLKNLRIDLSDAGNTAWVLDLNTPSATIQRVTAVDPNASNNSIAVSVHSGNVNFSRFDLSGSWTGQGLAMASAAVTLVRSHVQGGNGDKNAVLVTSGASLKAKRSVLSKTDQIGDDLEIQNGDATLESSILSGGATGLRVANTGAPVAATLRQLTIDPGSPGAGPGAAIDAQAPAPGPAVNTVTLENSIALGTMFSYQGTGQTSTVTCRHSELAEFQVQNPDPTPPGFGTIDCGSGHGNSSHPHQNNLFVNAPGGNLHLHKGSPMIDDGSTAPLAPGEYSKDIDGDKRIIDGDGNGKARRDKGADEFKP